MKQEQDNYLIFYDELTGTFQSRRHYSNDYIIMKTKLMDSYIKGNSEAGKQLDKLWDTEMDEEIYLQELQENKIYEKHNFKRVYNIPCTK